MATGLCNPSRWAGAPAHAASTAARARAATAKRGGTPPVERAPVERERRSRQHALRSLTATRGTDSLRRRAVSTDVPSLRPPPSPTPSSPTPIGDPCGAAIHDSNLTADTTSRSAPFAPAACVRRGTASTTPVPSCPGGELLRMSPCRGPSTEPAESRARRCSSRRHASDWRAAAVAPSDSRPPRLAAWSRRLAAWDRARVEAASRRRWAAPRRVTGSGAGAPSGRCRGAASCPGTRPRPRRRRRRPRRPGASRPCR